MRANPFFQPAPSLSAWAGATQALGRFWVEGWTALLRQQAEMVAAFNRQALGAWTGASAAGPEATPPIAAAEAAPLPEVILAPMADTVPLTAAPAAQIEVPVAEPEMSAPEVSPAVAKPAKRPKAAAPLRTAAMRKAAARPATKGRRLTRH